MERQALAGTGLCSVVACGSGVSREVDGVSAACGSATAYSSAFNAKEIAGATSVAAKR